MKLKKWQENNLDEYSIYKLINYITKDRDKVTINHNLSHKYIDWFFRVKNLLLFNNNNNNNKL